MMKTTEKERAIIRALIDMQKGKQSSTDIEELGYYLYEIWQLPKPTWWRSAMAATLRNLSSKVEHEGCRLRRVSKLGRGAKGRYQFNGNFAGLLRAPASKPSQPRAR
jgi:hypothetical protein